MRPHTRAHAWAVPVGDTGSDRDLPPAPRLLALCLRGSVEGGGEILGPMGMLDAAGEALRIRALEPASVLAVTPASLPASERPLKSPGLAVALIFGSPWLAFARISGLERAALACSV